MYYWFKRRRYGWGWTPVTTEGWLATLFFIVILLLAVLFLVIASQPINEWRVVLFLIVVISDFNILFTLSRQYGPKPKWRWGKKDTDNPREDF